MTKIRINYGSLRELLRENEPTSVFDMLLALTDHVRDKDKNDPALNYLESAMAAYDRPDATPETRTIEYYRMWDGGQWDTDFIDVPYDTDDEGIAEAVQIAANAIKWKDEIPVFVGVYHIPDDEEI